MPFNITIRYQRKTHQIQWEKRLLAQDFNDLIRSVFGIADQQFILLDNNGNLVIASY